MTPEELQQKYPLPKYYWREVDPSWIAIKTENNGEWFCVWFHRQTFSPDNSAFYLRIHNMADEPPAEDSWLAIDEALSDDDAAALVYHTFLFEFKDERTRSSRKVPSS